MTEQEKEAMRKAAISSVFAGAMLIAARIYEAQIRKMEEGAEREKLANGIDKIRQEANTHAVLAIELLSSVPRESQTEFLAMMKDGSRVVM